ncbi:MAG TPA: HAMP domain-containing protein, partial [Myxococcaceae bacterium]|nr:HAMP domain-containing protein [Myxococcaceae bacterium]
METLSETPAPPMSRAHRRLRNYLLDSRFQIRFTLYVVGATAVVAGLIGAFLWGTASRLLREVEGAVEARSSAAETSKELSQATLSNKLFQHFNDPAFEAQLREQSKLIDAKYEAERAAIVAQRAELVRQQRLLAWVLIGGFATLTLLIAFGSIVATHRIVGPLYRIKKMAQEVARGHLTDPSRQLREHDEFKDLFEEFAQMVRSLRENQGEEIRRLRLAIEALEQGESPKETLVELRRLRAGMEGRLT